MNLELTLHGSVKSHQRQGEDEGGQNDMRDQNGEIDRTHPTFSGEGYRTYLVVVVEVEGQKQTRGEEGRDHGYLVRANVLQADEYVTCR